MRSSLLVLGVLVAASPTSANERVRAPGQIPERSLVSRMFSTSPADRIAKQARNSQPAQAKQLLLGYFNDHSNLAQMSLADLKGVLKAAPDAATHDTLYRRYVRFWTPALRGNVSKLAELSGPGLNAAQDYLVLRYARERFFNKARGAQNDSLDNAEARHDFMWIASLARSEKRQGRSTSTRDFLLGRYAQALGTDLGHAKSEFRLWQSEQAAKAAAERAKSDADHAQLMTTINSINTINSTINRVNNPMSPMGTFGQPWQQ